MSSLPRNGADKQFSNIAVPQISRDPSADELLQLTARYAESKVKSENAPSFIENPWSYTAPGWMVFVVSAGVGLGLCAITAAFEMWLYWRGSSALIMMVSSDVLTGILAGLLYYKIVHAYRSRRTLIKHRLQVIAAMNHHVRNALEIIVLSAGSLEHPESVALINESTTRITWALREILGSEPLEED